MSAPVDVLAVMDAAIERVARPHEAGLHRARAAVAELIEAVKARKIAKRRLWLAQSDNDKAALSSARHAMKAAEDREAAALARVGGAA